MVAVGAPRWALVTWIVLGLVGGLVVVSDREHLHEVAGEVHDGGKLERGDEREELEQADEPEHGASTTTARNEDCTEEGQSGHEANVLAPGGGASS